MGTVQIIQRGTRDVDLGGPRIFFCQLTADKPVSGLRKDDRAITVDDGKVWIAASATTWAEQGWGWPAGGGGSEPPGVMKAYGGDTAPSGYLLCDGAAVSRTTYAALFAVIGTKYGSGDGSTTFNVPNRKGRVSVMQDAAIPDFDAIGKTGGAKTVTLGVGEIPAHTHVQDAHNHTQNSHNHIQDPHNHTQDAHTHVQNAHSHGQQIRNTGTSGTAGTQGANTANNVSAGVTDNATAVNQNAVATNQAATATNQAATATNQAATAVNQNAGGGGAHENMPPYLVDNWIIST